VKSVDWKDINFINITTNLRKMSRRKKVREYSINKEEQKKEKTVVEVVLIKQDI